MSNFTRSILYSTAVIALGLVAVMAIYSDTQSSDSMAAMEPAAGEVETIEANTGFTEEVRSMADKAMEGTSEAASATMDTMGDMTESAGEMAGNAADATAETAGSMMDGATEMATDAMDATMDAAAAVGEATSEGMETIGENIEGMMPAAGTEEAAEAAEETMQNAEDAAQDAMESAPTM